MYMQFTLYHLGPALALGRIFWLKVRQPTLVVANIVIDLKPY